MTRSFRKLAFFCMAALALLGAGAPSAFALSVDNQAFATFLLGPGAPETTVSSNIVSTVATLSASVDFYDPPYTEEIPTTPVGFDLFVQGRSPACNESAELAESLGATLVSALTGDEEAVSLVETAPDSGIFRIASPFPTRDGALAAAEPLDGVLDILGGDLLMVSIDGCGVPASGTVEVPLPAVVLPPATIDYYDPEYREKIARTVLGEDLHVQADAPACNAEISQAETRIIVIVSALTGDLEELLAEETAEDTGIFRVIVPVPTRDADLFPADPGNGILETVKGDTLLASIAGCGESVAETVIFIDPGGVVFDSRTDAPVAGAIVRLIDVTGGGNGQPTEAGVACSAGIPGGLAKVLDYAASAVLPSEQVTGEDGRYDFPVLCPSTYRIEVVPPGEYLFPSTVPAADLPPERRIDPAASYGGEFELNLSTGAVFIDLPLDRPFSVLSLEKRVNRSTAEIADVVQYTLTVVNASGQDFPNVTVEDFLPYGFVFSNGSARIDGVRIADPKGGGGRQLTFAVGEIPAGSRASLTYRAAIGPGALQGDGVNTAFAVVDGSLVSNRAQARVDVVPGVFTSRGYVVGKVYVNCDWDRRQGDEEPGIPGVRLFMQDGSFVVTDAEGKFSFYGLSPSTHVLRIDETTLPAGSEMITLSNRFAGDAGSRFIDIKNGELHRADFAEGSCTGEILEQVVLRRERGDVFVADVERRVREILDADPSDGTEETSLSASASGYVEDTPKVPTFEPMIDPGDVPDTSQPPLLVPALISLEDLLDGIEDTTPAFLDLRDGDTLPFAQVHVRIKGPEGGRFRLSLNGETVSERRVGKRIIDPSRGLLAWEYIGVNLEPGENTLALTYVDPFGNDRQSETIRLVAPDGLGEIAVTPPDAGLVADGHSVVPLKVELKDPEGVPVTVRTQLTLEASLGRWDVVDLDPETPGIQVFIEGGSATFGLRPPQEPGEALVVVSSGILEGACILYFLPDLRPIIATGLVEGVVNLSRLGSAALVGASPADGFERELDNISGGEGSAGARAAFFLKGKVRGDTLLTVAYDSEKETRERLFRDIEPDAFYPVYGDASVRGYDAQSTGRLYVRVDRKKSYLLLGDFSTLAPAQARKLSLYNRSFNGAKFHHETERVNLNAFVSEDGTRQVVEEIAAKGVSGPYFLKESDLVVNSERVEIVTRDRNQKSRIVAVDSLARFTDYELDVLSGRIVLRAPVPIYDQDLNPNFIRVTYETEGESGHYWIAGGDAQARLHDRVEVGGVLVHDDSPVERYTMGGANMTVKVAPKTFLVGEWAETSGDVLGTGEGKRVELQHTGDTFSAAVYAHRTDENFDNPSSLLLAGREEAGANARLRLTRKTSLGAEALLSRDLENDGERKGLLVNLEHAFNGSLRGELGLRLAEETTAPAEADTTGATPFSTTSVRAKLAARVPFAPRAGVFVEAEQAIDAGDRRSVGVGGDYQLSNGGRIYAQHRFVSTLAGEFSLNDVQERNVTLVGVESPYMRRGNVFSEYRIRDSVSGRDSEAAVGLRNAWTLAEGVIANVGIERVHALTGSADNSSTAVTGALVYSGNPLWKGSLRAEVHNGESSDSFLGSAGLALKMSRDWTLLSRNVYSLLEGDGTSEERQQERYQIGFAYRPVDNNRWNVLSRYEFKREEEEFPGEQREERSVHIFSTHLNVQPSRAATVSGRCALKWTDEKFGSDDDSTSAQLLAGRLIYDITERWDAGFLASALAREDDALNYGIGGEIGYLFAANLWISGGYNFLGFYDRDLSGEDYTNPGFYMRFRFKFDEHLLDGNDPEQNKTISPDDRGTKSGP
ncbi:MAG: hypothetical protein C0617_02850 [Desulfuromonas sp.]|uniref:hypothetical protein n=1 Tax=Desulfuromonas sp. TaxID=892 RepID=UPI000CC771E2|nr:hypothetical protein [Desulfuromonas sp.]PLX85824.1 MAG: hypothetical protein C0617_02850 [Desulfuromonas sp.]